MSKLDSALEHRSLRAGVASKHGSCLSVLFVCSITIVLEYKFLMYLSGSIPCGVLQSLKDSVVAENFFNSPRVQPILLKSGIAS